MKKVYYLDMNSEFATDLREAGLLGIYSKRKEAYADLVSEAKKVKKMYAKELKEEAEAGNTITLDLYEAEARDDFDLELCCFWELDYRLIDSRYLCGRY